jgi:hypothetical protein
MDRRQQIAAAAERYRGMARDREELRRQQAEGTRVVDTPERGWGPGRALAAGRAAAARGAGEGDRSKQARRCCQASPLLTRKWKRCR